MVALRCAGCGWRPFFGATNGCVLRWHGVPTGDMHENVNHGEAKGQTALRPSLHVAYYHVILPAPLSMRGRDILGRPHQTGPATDCSHDYLGLLVRRSYWPYPHFKEGLP